MRHTVQQREIHIIDQCLIYGSDSKVLSNVLSLHPIFTTSIYSTIENCFDSDYIDEPLEPVLEDSNIELIFDDAEEETVTFENNQNDIFQRSESSKATRKFKRPLPRYVEQDQTDVACKIQIDQSPKNNTANAQETWAEWTPTKLKKPLSTELTVNTFFQ
ncbi:hypothetical protein JTB14_016023 [Gonioctena quinquepunctata]|nr:hypothetical protein JTB14_016023 [Gonioctena quinquepunctata]